MLPILVVPLLACAPVFARTASPAGTSSVAAREDMNSLPHDRHDGVNVAVDPYAQSSRAKKKFGKADPLRAGILPVEVVLRNDTPNPIHIDLSTVQLDIRLPGGRLQGLDWLRTQDVANAIAHPHGLRPPETRRFPIGVPSESDRKTQKLLDILQPLALNSDIIPPKGMIHGFLFFDLKHNFSLVTEASLYIPNATVIPSQKPLMFFEVHLSRP